MKVDGELPMGMGNTIERIGQLVEAGYSGAQTVETGHDPFLPLVLAAEHSKDIDLMTAIAVAFARNPMNLAAIGNDLNAFSQGRFILGLGSHKAPHRKALLHALVETGRANAGNDFGYACHLGDLVRWRATGFSW